MKYIIINLVFLFFSFNYARATSNKTIIHKQEKAAYIRVITDEDFSNDNLELTYRDNNWGVGAAVSVLPKKTITAKIGKLIKIEFKNNESFLYANLVSKKGKVFFISTIIAPDDDIEIHSENGKLIFSGKGKEKFELQQRIEEEFNAWSKKQTELKYFKDGKNEIVFKFLKQFKSRISPNIFQIIKADYLFDGDFDSMYIDSASFILRSENQQGISPKFLNKSSGYLEYMYKAISKRKYDPETTISFINHNFSGSLRDRLLTLYLIRRSIKSHTDVDLLSEILETIKTDYCIKALKTFKGNSSPGSDAFEFSLRDTSGNIIKQSDFKGKVVLIDFFFTGCGWCQLMNEKMKGVFAIFKDNPNIKFVSISIDKDQKKWKDSIKSLKYTHDGTVNLYTNGEGSNSKVIEHYNIKGYPRTILIDKDGRVVSASPPEPHNEKNKNELINLINSLL